MKYFFIFPIIPAGFRPESGRIPGGSGRIPDRNQLSGSQGLFSKKIFWIALLYRKIDRKITFDFTALWEGA
jgi:hypothetical protein